MEDFIITRDKMGERRTPIQYKGIDQTEDLKDLETFEKEVEATPKPRKTFKQRLAEEKEKPSDEPTA